MIFQVRLQGDFKSTTSWWLILSEKMDKNGWIKALEIQKKLHCSHLNHFPRYTAQTFYLSNKLFTYLTNVLQTAKTLSL